MAAEAGSPWQKLLSRIDSRSDKIRVEVEFEVAEDSIPAPLAHYETGTGQDMPMGKKAGTPTARPDLRQRHPWCYHGLERRHAGRD